MRFGNTNWIGGGGGGGGGRGREGREGGGNRVTSASSVIENKVI